MITRAAIFVLTALARACELAAVMLWLIHDIVSWSPPEFYTVPPFLRGDVESPFEEWAGDEGAAVLKMLEIGEIGI